MEKYDDSCEKDMSNAEAIRWKDPLKLWVLLGVLLVLVYFIYLDGINEMVGSWSREEYSHGFMIPIITIFLIWQRKNILSKIEYEGSWAGVLLVLFGILLFAIGSLSSVLDIIAYGFVITIFGLFLAYIGRKGYVHIAMPLIMLLFMIPLPGFLYQSISNQLQLISSEIGVAVIRLFDISVYLEGNVIDLGVYKLQVVEACSGLRYLFPLVSLGFIAAYLYKVEMWKRVFVFLSTIPITVLMNSARIGLIGVTVEYWGIEMAEGFLHDFEGWFVFMTCMVVLFAEMVILTRIGRDSRSFGEVFGLVLPSNSVSSCRLKTRSIPYPVYLSIALLASALMAKAFIPERHDNIPDRNSFAVFPKVVGEWTGIKQKMDSKYVDALNFDDYILADYLNSKNESVGLYIGYYDFQRADKVPHSPKACLPGGGWAITDLSTIDVKNVSISNVPLMVNRAVIQQGEYKQLVYYWFQQRGRIITNEWYVKLYLLLDAININRTDGALIRLTTLVSPGEDINKADQRLTNFSSSLSQYLADYVPD